MQYTPSFCYFTLTRCASIYRLKQIMRWLRADCCRINQSPGFTRPNGGSSNEYKAMQLPGVKGDTLSQGLHNSSFLAGRLIFFSWMSLTLARRLFRRSGRLPVKLQCQLYLRNTSRGANRLAKLPRFLFSTDGIVCRFS